MIPNTPAAWDERAEAHAAAHEAAMWSRNGQRTRFERAIEWAQPREGESVLDFGCGPGALAGWVPLCRYTGVDWSERMRERAAADYPRATFYPSLDDLPESVRDETWVFTTGDRQGQPVPGTGGWLASGGYDCVFAIGPFNLRDGWAAEQTHATVMRLWALTQRVLVVSVRRGHEDDDHISYDADSLASFADIRARSWVLDAGYLTNDMMLVMHR